MNESFANSGVLYRSSGTTFSTARVAYIFPGGNSKANQLVSIGGRLFFVATNGVPNTNNLELWTSDGVPGSPGAATLSQEINNSNGSFPEELTGITLSGVNYLFFSADDSPGATSGSTSPDRELFIKNVTANTPAQKVNLKL
ncbi:MAG: hypothetical protein HC880_06720 [Bacteroidia bacterium]|nr:hypothetical protein [Bacteroidia bacterium]